MAPPWRKLTQLSADRWLVEFGSDDTAGTATVRRFQPSGLILKVNHAIGLYLDAWDEDGQPVVNIDSLRHGEN